MKMTIGMMVDLLTIQNLKIWHSENIKRSPDSTDSEVAEAARTTNKVNSFRNSLIDEIDLAMNEIAEGKKQKLFGSNKIYGKK